MDAKHIEKLFEAGNANQSEESQANGLPQTGRCVASRIGQRCAHAVWGCRLATWSDLIGMIPINYQSTDGTENIADGNVVQQGISGPYYIIVEADK